MSIFVVKEYNAWYRLGEEYARICCDSDLDNFLKAHDLYTTINVSSHSSFRKGTFEKLIAVLDKNNINTSDLKEMYLNNKNNEIDGHDRYSFYWGYDIEKLRRNNHGKIKC